MRNFVFGMDSNHPSESARLIRECGFDAVVLGNASSETANALEAEGIESLHAHSDRAPQQITKVASCSD